MGSGLRLGCDEGGGKGAGAALEDGDEKDKCSSNMEMKVRMADGEQRGFVWVKGVGDEVRSKAESGDSGIASPG